MAADDAIKDHAAERRLFVVRTLVIGTVLGVMVATLVARVAYLQVYRHAYYETRSQDNRMRVQVIPPVRGLIYDRDGVVLADNLPAYRLEIVAEQVEDLDATLDRLGEVVEIREADRQRFRDRLSKTPDFRGVPIRMNLSQREVARFEVNRGAFPGVEIRAGLTRHYPLGRVAAHLVGYVGGITAEDLNHVDNTRYRGSNHIGKSGVEYSFESRLHGYPGSRVVETNASGRALRELEMNRPTAGENLYLTVDARLQSAAYEALGDHDGAVVAMSPETGGLLAMVSKPSYEPDLFVDGISHDDYRQLTSDPHLPLYNRAMQGRYPPGSTIKPVWHWPDWRPTPSPRRRRSGAPATSPCRAASAATATGSGPATAGWTCARRSIAPPTSTSTSLRSSSASTTCIATVPCSVWAARPASTCRANPAASCPPANGNAVRAVCPGTPAKR